MHDRECPGGREAEESPGGVGPEEGGRAVEVAVAALGQGGDRIGSFRVGGDARRRIRCGDREAVEAGQRAAGRHPEHGALATRAAIAGGAVEVAVGGLDEFRLRVGSIRVGKAVEGGQRSAGGDPEDGAEAARAAPRVVP